MDSVPSARRFLRAALISLGAEGACDDAETLVAELATNVVLHARTEFSVDVARNGDAVRVLVRDLSPVLPRKRDYGLDATTGRGMRLVESLSTDWGVERVGGGKAVWFDLPVDGNPSVVPAWDKPWTWARCSQRSTKPIS